MNTQSNRRTIRNLVIFTSLVIILPWLGRGLDTLMGFSASQEGLGQLIWIMTPLAVSLLLRAFAGDGWQDIGIRPALKGNGLWYAISILAYPLCTALILAIGRVLGAVSFPDTSPDKVGAVVQAMALAVLPQFLINTLEESGFRGYLAPKLATLELPSWVMHAIVGLVWGIWHLPYLSFVTSYTTESPATLIPRFLVGTIAASLVYGEIRMRTHSVWPAVLMQTVGGALLSGLLLEGFFEISDGLGFLFSPVVEGLLTILFFVLVGVCIQRLGKERKT